ncbi:uncharacterized protein [Spinacia oleracea]|uniref:SWIM-type domain-containing protein n=1 Tax=Spinacia oleracea TaxID=3562 RepID=A0A9R0J216_SPIOL|nr:uncharacterized protein LOC110799025 [Spinacia oleracea]
MNRCKFPWDTKRSKRVKCTCGEILCNFKILAMKVRDEETLQIRTTRLKHDCCYANWNRQVTAEYLAERYLEVFRNDPTWALVKGFGVRVLQETGVECGYNKLWYARARVKYLLYADGAEQYKRVWDYVEAVKKHIEGSYAICCTETIDRPPPVFQRMFICLKPVLDGFMRGCRSIIGLDGCHLTGLFTGICLVAVASDGNNNIYPLAWAVVDTERTDTWTWFIDLLGTALGTTDGEGWTFMSDRQKGLLEAFKNVVPKAEIRFCWRHVWCNFKEKFPGQAFKEQLWSCATATTQLEFNKQMEDLKLLSVGAHAYMDKIPPKYWSRHAFSSRPKSKMLLNNMCESFNNVLKQARDKPILTHMEWMRRYVMQRHCKKREGVRGMLGKFMPYVRKQLEWAETQRRFCLLSKSSDYFFEVENNNNIFIVDLFNKKCTCYSWELTGIPCHHAYACILYMRLNPEDFVADWYSKEMYMVVYEAIVPPLPGPNHWEKSQNVEPAPLPYITMPGRPSKKKRNIGAGEAEEAAQKKGKDVPPGLNNKKQNGKVDDAQHAARGGRQNKCGNCKKLGHNRKTCKEPMDCTVEIRPPPTGKPPSDDPWCIYRRERREALQKQKEANADIVTQASQTSIASCSQQPQSSPSHAMFE